MKYAYVICFIDPTNRLPPSFAHTFVEAEDDSDAYSAGYKQVEIVNAKHEFPTRPFNDYVFPVGGDDAIQQR